MFSLTYDSDSGGTFSVTARAGGPSYLSSTEDVELPCKDLLRLSSLLEAFATTLEFGND